ncbi:collagen alpha-1(X) chain-like [Acanthaster planci]|uniref:Collagen alpha-1(X) chain-like n=1 Tax=Acanthaster planci TaxID=133434 RepID=A0A8B7XHK0_ACAPL|nr:collagen alpha-1(X) chain-like [Acanthaster planci]
MILAATLSLFLLCGWIAACNTQPSSESSTTSSTPGSCYGACYQGPAGVAGVPGVPGLPGSNGVQGPTGPTGEPGIGLRGPKGEKGDPGAKGDRGETGVGLKGVVGSPGVAGEMGQKGEKGEPGETSTVTQALQSVVAFTAFLTSDVSRDSGDVVVFPYVETNIGGGYDSQSGVFTCSVPGLYFFSVTLMTESNTNPRVDAFLKRNSDNIFQIHDEHDNHHHQPSNSAVIQLVIGDTVKIETSVAGISMHGSSYHPSSFSGFLIHQM